ncbi:MAG: hypothetical protein AAF196_04990 [Planctomycetota bacterium]
MSESEVVAATLEIRTAETMEDRFGLAKPTIPFGAFRSSLPDGWTRLPAERLRDDQIEAPNGVRAWITQIEGTGGGPVPNLRRWSITQLGMPEMPALDSLPRVPWLGGNAYLVRLEHEGRRLEGRMVFLSGLAVFVRVMGTSDELDPILGDFDEWVDSIVLAHGGLGTSWLPPEAFELQRPGQRLLAKYRVGGCDAWVLIEGSDLGGLEANIDRWLGQVGAARDDGRSRIEPIELDGVAATLVRARGPRSAMDAIYCFDGETCATLKMTGSISDVEAQKAAFDQWVSSFEWEGN